jgi:hypothetical protein
MGDVCLVGTEPKTLQENIFEYGGTNLLTLLWKVLKKKKDLENRSYLMRSGF